MRKTIGTFLLALALMAPSCGQRSETTAAMKALSRVRNATSIGVSREEYLRLLLDATEAVESAKGKAKEEDFKALATILDTYRVAGRAWTYGESIPVGAPDYALFIIADPKSLGRDLDVKTVLQHNWAIAASLADGLKEQLK